MKPFAAALVVFLLVAGAAGYWIASTDHATTVPARPLFAYTQEGRYTYVAALGPNSLYNQTHLTPGNGTLFSAITQWVNLSFSYRLTIDRLANASVAAETSVLLQSSVWTKTLATWTASTTIAADDLATLRGSYDLNVTNVTHLASAIEKETGYTPSSYAVVVSTSVHAFVGVAGSADGLSFSPTLTFNFTASQIKPSSLQSNGAGAFVPPGDPATVVPGSVSIVAYLLLVGALGGVAAMGYLLYETREPKPAPDLAVITRPYEEAIVDASAPPSASALVPVRTWEDIVKAADTLGAPIVRVGTTAAAPGTSAPPRATAFYVVSGNTGFVYDHAARSGGASASVAADRPFAAAAPAPRPPATAAPPHLRDWSERYPRIPGANRSLESFVEWSDRISDRLRWFRPSSALRQDSEELLLRAIGLAQRGRADAGWVILGQLYARLGPWERPGAGPLASTRGPSPGPLDAPAPTRPTGPRPGG